MLGVLRLPTWVCWENDGGGFERKEKRCGEIDSLGVVFSSSFGRKLGNGDGIQFWKDKWAGDFKLCERFSRLFRFEGDEDVLLRNHGVPRGRSVDELEELNGVLRYLAPISVYVDSSHWFLASDGVFSVKHIRDLIDE
ncbi:hypothetical protein Tco_0482354 [Tanacetum coccineum]